ncbi:MAG: CPBP family intramembrane metalloprotease [Anaerolineales bacterium]|nr:CPBP family intramembrane metalloprotease [Anaerolineales bacterium]
MAAERKRFSFLWGMPLLVALTFAVPGLQSLFAAAGVFPAWRNAAACLLIILGAALWQGRAKSVAIIPSAFGWKSFCAAGALAALGLLAANLVDPPTARISGLVRTPGEILESVVLGPQAEEWIFRAVLWWLLPRAFPKTAWGDWGLLAATSVAFGVEHLGYWALNRWPLPADAYLHALEMIPAGTAFAFLRMKSRSLAAPAVGHMLANGLILLLQ